MATAIALVLLAYLALWCLGGDRSSLRSLAGVESQADLSFQVSSPAADGSGDTYTVMINNRGTGTASDVTVHLEVEGYVVSAWSERDFTAAFVGDGGLQRSSPRADRG